MDALMQLIGPLAYPVQFPVVLIALAVVAGALLQSAVATVHRQPRWPYALLRVQLAAIILVLLGLELAGFAASAPMAAMSLTVWLAIPLWFAASRFWELRSVS